MEFGCCVNAGTFVPQAQGDKTASGIERLAHALGVVKESGFDFVEYTVGLAMNPPGGDFEALRQATAESGLVVPAFNSFIPPDLKLTGPAVDKSRVAEYLDEACKRVATLGGKLIVFGSGGARSLPEGWDPAKGREQLVEFLHAAADAARPRGLFIVIEPLNRKESNVINSVADAVALAGEVNRPEVRVLADLYHMQEEQEPLDAAREHAERLAHAHVADTGRFAPGTGDWPFKEFFGLLRSGGYRGAISIECRWKDFDSEAPAACAFLRRTWELVSAS